MSEVHSEVQPTETAPLVSGMSAFEEAQIRVERLKAWLTAGTIVASVLAATLAYSSAQRVQSQQARDAFQLKVAEIVMSSRNAFDAQGKANALSAFFPDKVPANMPQKIDPKTQSWGHAGRSELLTLLAAHPDPNYRKVTLKTYKALFPENTFANDVPSAP